MNKYRISIDFLVEDKLNIPPICIGNSFFFCGDLNYLGDITLKGKMFVLKINSINECLEKLNIEYNNNKPNSTSEYIDKNIECDDKTTSISSKNHENDALELNYGSKTNSLRGSLSELSYESEVKKSEPLINYELFKKNVSELKSMNYVPGVITFSYSKNNPIEYTILNLTHFIRKKWDEQSLENDAKILNITHLYTIGTLQITLVKQYVKNIPVLLWLKPNNFFPKCIKCFRYGCTIYKSKCVMCDILNYFYIDASCGNKDL